MKAQFLPEIVTGNVDDEHKEIVTVEDQAHNQKMQYRAACMSVGRTLRNPVDRSPLVRGFDRSLPRSIVKRVIKDRGSFYRTRPRLRIGFATTPM